MIASIRDGPHQARKTRIDYEWYFDDLKVEDVTDASAGNQIITAGMSYLWEARKQPEPNAAFAMTFGYDQRHSNIDALSKGKSHHPNSFLNNLSSRTLPIL
jgi:hypothetical protein